LGGRRSSDIVANLVPGAKRVKAFNTLLAAALAADPKQGGGQRVIFVSGDDDGEGPAALEQNESFTPARSSQLRSFCP
jgi:predicted dinucleotide-binding enzyme